MIIRGGFLVPDKHMVPTIQVVKVLGLMMVKLKRTRNRVLKNKLTSKNQGRAWSTNKSKLKWPN